MKPSLRFLASLLIFSCAIEPVIAQDPTDTKDEFRSILGRFGIQLPHNYSDYKAAAPLELSGQKFFVSIYRWNTPMGQFSVSYADGTADLEVPERNNFFLTDFRTQVLGHSAGSKLLSERRLALESHPVLELVAESASARTTTEIIVVKNRFYLLTMSLSAEQESQSEQAAKAFASFRLLPPATVYDELRKIADKFAPEPLPQEPFVGRATTDAQDEGLKGKVKTVTSEREFYFGNSLLGLRYLHSDLEFNERGDLTKSVEYEGLPTTVTVYGYSNGERAARIALKPFEFILLADKSTGEDRYMPPGSRPKIESLKFKYKYDNNGRLLDKLVLFSDGRVFERKSYNIKSKKMEHFGGSLLGRVLSIKTTYLLDDNWNPVEEDSTHSSTEPYSYNVGGNVFHGEKVTTETARSLYTYEFDPQGNWIKRVTTRVEKKDGKFVSTPYNIIYRTIIYF